ncbi:glycosyltransferase family 2 protein [Actinocorallia populi]|uniref:glycosyltransferase family 2 protein n=1 Tax=Actinocorallia populi TaxID=2079200 RepID=UPI001E28E349|nr:cellulose synthase catalytic subunit [Actinocorallia populi]
MAAQRPARPPAQPPAGMRVGQAPRPRTPGPRPPRRPVPPGPVGGDTLRTMEDLPPMPRRPQPRGRRLRPVPPIPDPSPLLPQPPNDEEKYSYVARHLWVMNVGSLVSFIFLAITAVKFVSISALWLAAPFLFFTVLNYVLSLRIDLFSKNFDLKHHKKIVDNWKPDVYPSVDVFLPVCGEPIEVIHNTWTAVRRVVEHYPGKVVPYVLDDGASPELAAMAADFGFRYGSRPNQGWYKKAGNLQFGFHSSDGDFILLLDADFAPRHDILDEVLPVMYDEPDVGIVQTPQFFRVLDHQTWVERGAGASQELFYRSVQVSRQRRNGSICVGSCAVYRRAALNDNNGTTLIEHSEDIHTGYDLQVLGWGTKYVPIALSAGVCPDNPGAFHNQQYRWCMGSFSLLGAKKFWKAPLPVSTKISFSAGMLYYLHTALFTFVAPILPIMMLIGAPDLMNLKHMVWLLPSLIYATIIFPAWHRAPFRLEAWAVGMMQGWAHVFALWDMVRGREMGWKPSGSSGVKKNKMRRVIIAYAVWSGGCSIIWVGLSCWRMATMYPPDVAMALSTALFYAVVVGRVLVEPREFLKADED